MQKKNTPRRSMLSPDLEPRPPGRTGPVCFFHPVSLVFFAAVFFSHSLLFLSFFFGTSLVFVDCLAFSGL
jgi:hypothetical protein